MLKGVIFRVRIRIITLDGSWIIPNFSSNLCPTHQPKFARAHTFPFSRAVIELLRRNSTQSPLKRKNNICTNTELSHGVPKLDRVFHPLRAHLGLQGQCWEVKSPLLHSQSCREAQGAQLMLTPVNTRPCFDKGLKGRHRAHCLEEMRGWDGFLLSQIPRGSEWGCFPSGKAPLWALTPWWDPDTMHHSPLSLNLSSAFSS